MLFRYEKYAGKGFFGSRHGRLSTSSLLGPGENADLPICRSNGWLKCRC